MATEDSAQREMTGERLREAARAGNSLAMNTPGAPRGVIAGEGLPRAVKLTGRDLALRETLERLASATEPEALCIAGPPGVGATVFAAEVVAYACARNLYPAGAVWVFCEARSGYPGLDAIFARVARGAGSDAARETIPERLRQALHDDLHGENAPRLLIALDGVEPSLDATALLDTLAGGRATLLITARQSLQDTRARDISLGPLTPADAALLFQEWPRAGAREHSPTDGASASDSQPVWGGLPLAIGLASSLAAFAPEPPPSPAMEPVEPRALLDRSWAALPIELKRALAGLALVEAPTFPRGIALAIARAALADPTGAPSGDAGPGASGMWRERAAETLDTLVGMRLLDPVAGGRLRLHSLIRRYAAARLIEMDSETSDALGAAMAGWWLDFARAHEGRAGAAALAIEAGGLMSGLTWARARERHQLTRDLVSAAHEVWRAHSTAADLRAALSWVVEAARALGDAAGLRAALHELATCDAGCARLIEARAEYGEALRLAREQSDERAIALETASLRDLPVDGEPGARASL